MVLRPCSICGIHIRISYLEDQEECRPVCRRCKTKSHDQPPPEPSGHGIGMPFGGMVGSYHPNPVDPLADIVGEPDRHEVMEHFADKLGGDINGETNIDVVHLGFEYELRLVRVRRKP